MNNPDLKMNFETPDLSNDGQADERGLSNLNDGLCWTYEAPKEDGYYWLDRGDNYEPVIVQVFSFIKQKRFSLGGDTVGIGVEMVGSNSQWSDKPIQLPT